jgi:hypothetical protein
MAGWDVSPPGQCLATDVGMGIDERLVSRPHLLPSRFTRTGSDGYTPG